MIGPLAAIAQGWLRQLEPENAHRAAIGALKLAGALPAVGVADDARLAVKALGLVFPHPLGLSAGFDKSAEAVAGLTKLGFAFVEVGTLTPRPQIGNARPRLFRLNEDAAIINRMGFNNDGYEAASGRLAAGRPAGIVGANFGPNRDAADRVADFVAGVKTFSPLVDYLTVNISSPNTSGLRDLQRRDALDDLVARVVGARDAEPQRRPLLVKIAPDLTLRELDDVCSVAIRRRIDGLIISNTTVERPAGLRSTQATETGGLSGRPLFGPSTRLLARAYLRCEGAITLVGAGGVEDCETALAKIEAGADLVQIYTGFVYRGAAVIGEIRRGLAAEARARGVTSIQALVGGKARDFAARGAD
jgi:dihydroorotate dehydrogenase